MTARCEPADLKREDYYWFRDADEWRILQWSPTIAAWWDAGWDVPLSPEAVAERWEMFGPVSRQTQAEIDALVEIATKMRTAADALYVNLHAGRQLREWSVKQVTDLSNALAEKLKPFPKPEVPDGN